MGASSGARDYETRRTQKHLSEIMFASATAALPQIFTPPFRSVLIKSLGLTLVLLALMWVGLDKVIVGYIAVPYPWLASILSFLTGVGLMIGLAFFIAPISSLVAGFYLDDLAEVVEKDIGITGRALPAGQAMWLATKFAAISLFVNAFALAVFLLPGVNLAVFFLANAYLLGREYFELASLRFRSLEETHELRRRNRFYIFLCGLLIACFVAVPIVNLLTPLFGTAFMVRIHARLAREDRVLIQAGR
jgi:CysZ protein